MFLLQIIRSLRVVKTFSEILSAVVFSLTLSLSPIIFRTHRNTRRIDSNFLFFFPFFVFQYSSSFFIRAQIYIYIYLLGNVLRVILFCRLCPRRIQVPELSANKTTSARKSRYVFFFSFHLIKIDGIFFLDDETFVQTQQTSQTREIHEISRVPRYRYLLNT